MVFFGLALLIGLFHREILRALLLWTSSAERHPDLTEGSYLEAQVGKRPSVYFMNQAPCEALSLSSLHGVSLLVSKDFWTSLEYNERDALLAWAHSAAKNDWMILRILGLSHPKVADRNTAFFATHPVKWVSLFERALVYKIQHRPSALGLLVQGLSLTGSPLLGTSVDPKMRIKAFVDSLTRLKK